MKETLIKWLATLGFKDNDQAYVLAVIVLIALTSLILHVILHRVVLTILGKDAGISKQVWRRALFRRKLFTRLALTAQGIIISMQARIWLDPDSAALPVIEILTQLWVLIYGLLSLFSFLDTLEDVSFNTASGRRLPLRGIFQSIKLVGGIITLIFAIALLIGKSPLILFSGLGAMTAVLLLIFKDPLLGLVAGIQLSANKMLAVGDSLEMPKYGADGEVIDINLTTVKVRNGDKTITTVPTYALITDSFKNSRGISEAGGRRIKRAINIDATSVRFLTDDELARLRKVQLLGSYIDNKMIEIEAANREQNIDPASPVDGRRLTNLGTFRAYLSAYLGANKNIHTEMIQVVRQLAPSAEGIPIEIYAFSNTIDWIAYENIQGDIFDHIFAVIPEFGLRVYQAPSSYDVRELGRNRTAPNLNTAS